jgi:hypothetical protein
MKRIIRINIIFLLGALLNSCGSKSDPESLLAHKSGQSSKLIVCIQPFGGKNGEIDPPAPFESDPHAPLQIDPLKTEQIDPLFRV